MSNILILKRGELTRHDKERLTKNKVNFVEVNNPEAVKVIHNVNGGLSWKEMLDAVFEGIKNTSDVNIAKQNIVNNLSKIAKDKK